MSCTGVSVPGQVPLPTATPGIAQPEGPQPPLGHRVLLGAYTLTATDCKTEPKLYKATRLSFSKHVSPLSSFPAQRRRARLLTHAKGRAKAAERTALTPAGKRQPTRGERGGRLRPPARLLLPSGAVTQGCRGPTVTMTVTMPAPAPP